MNQMTPSATLQCLSRRLSDISDQPGLPPVLKARSESVRDLLTGIETALSTGVEPALLEQALASSARAVEGLEGALRGGRQRAVLEDVTLQAQVLEDTASDLAGLRVSPVLHPLAVVLEDSDKPGVPVNIRTIGLSSKDCHGRISGKLAFMRLEGGGEGGGIAPPSAQVLRPGERARVGRGEVLRAWCRTVTDLRFPDTPSREAPPWLRPCWRGAARAVDVVMCSEGTLYGPLVFERVGRVDPDQVLQAWKDRDTPPPDGSIITKFMLVLLGSLVAAGLIGTHMGLSDELKRLLFSIFFLVSGAWFMGTALNRRFRPERLARQLPRHGIGQRLMGEAVRGKDAPDRRIVQDGLNISLPTMILPR